MSILELFLKKENNKSVSNNLLPMSRIQIFKANSRTHPTY